MGLKFRKSVKVAPGVKLNLNKKSTSVTFGGKGAHYTVSSTGKKTKSVGIPGTGLSYVETEHINSKKSKASSSKPKQKEKVKSSHVLGCAVELFGFLFLICIVIAIIFGGNDSENTDDASAIVQENSIDSSEETAQPQTTTMYATADLNVREGAGTDYNTVGQLNLGDTVEVYSTENGWSKIDYNGTECFVSANYLSSTVPDTTSADTSTPPATSPEDQTQTAVGQTVYWTPNGEVYHSTSDCPSLARSKTILSGSIEESGKSRPCENCY